MTTPSLYLIQSSYGATPAVLEQLAQLYQTNDHVILLGDAVLFAHDPNLEQITEVYVLDTETKLMVEPYASNIRVIDYAHFAELCLKHSRCISLK